MELLSINVPSTCYVLVVCMLITGDDRCAFNISGGKLLSSRLPANAYVTSQSSLLFTRRDDRKCDCFCRLLPSWPL